MSVQRSAACRGQIIRVKRPCREHVQIQFRVESFPRSTAGQFLQVACADSNPQADAVHDWSEGTFPSLNTIKRDAQHAFLRRPFSIANRSDQNGATVLEIISRAIGPGTRWLDHVNIGDAVNVSGPLGSGFAPPDPRETAVLIGGGVGIPPLLYFARQLADRNHQDALAIFGALSGDLLAVNRGPESPHPDGSPTQSVQFPGDATYPTAITTDDGSLGLHGRVTDAFAAWRNRAQVPTNRLRVYACGPDPMLRAVARICAAANINCELCIERTMGCGFGTCQSCVVRVKAPERNDGWRWALACSDGPVFNSNVLLGYAAPDPAPAGAQ